MINRMKCLAVMVAILLAPSWDVAGQDQVKFPHLRVGIDGGYFQPLGAWAEHRYAQGTDLFGGSATLRGELELRMRRLGIALNASYTKLNTGAWEAYARDRDDELEASASLTQFGLLLKPYFKMRRPHAVNLEFGLIYSLPSGEERFAGRRFEYDFLKAVFGFMAGVGYERYLSQSTALTFRLGWMFAPGGVHYADGTTYGLSGLPATVGIRFDLGGGPANQGASGGN